MNTHRMRARRVPELGKVVFTCLQCERCIEIDDDGALRVVARGDAESPHRGGTFGAAGEGGFGEEAAGLDAEVRPAGSPDDGPALH